MVRERWWVDGWELTDGWFRDIEVRDGLVQSTPMSSQAQETYVKGRHGYLPGARRTFDGGSFVVVMWLLEDRWADVDAAYHTLLRAASPQHRLAHWQHLCADGSTRECWARLVSAIQPEVLGQVGMRVSLELAIPAAFWQDSAVTTDLGPAGVVPSQVPLLSKANGSAPMADLVYTITGPVNNPMVQCISDPAIADSFTVAAAVPAGAVLTLDSGTWKVTATGMLAPGLDVIGWTGDRLLEVPPASPGQVPTVQLTGSGSAGGTRLSVSGRAKYLAA